MLDFKCHLFFLKALCFAKTKGTLAYAYANRSAVYFELKKYEESLKSIQWARESEYPEDKIQKLLDREAQCHELIDEDYERNKAQLRDFFTLSYPANPKIPFVVDCLEQKDIDDSTKGVFTNRDLKAGDIIAIEDPFAFGYLVNYLGCCVCMRVNMMNLIPSDENCKIKFTTSKSIFNNFPFHRS